MSLKNLSIFCVPPSKSRVEILKGSGPSDPVQLRVHDHPPCPAVLRTGPPTASCAASWLPSVTELDTSHKDMPPKPSQENKMKGWNLAENRPITNNLQVGALRWWVCSCSFFKEHTHPPKGRTCPQLPNARPASRLLSNTQAYLHSQQLSSMIVKNQFFVSQSAYDQ